MSEIARIEKVDPVKAERNLVLELVEAEREKLRNLKTNPKGMTHGEVQDRIARCDRILAEG